jgi:hypothetical protein
MKGIRTKVGGGGTGKIKECHYKHCQEFINKEPNTLGSASTFPRSLLGYMIEYMERNSLSERK